jgi:hypothetical protein
VTDYTTNDDTVEFSMDVTLLFIISFRTYLGKWFQTPAPCSAKAPSMKLSKTFTEAVSPLVGCFGNCHWAVMIHWIEHWSQDGVEDSSFSTYKYHWSQQGNVFHSVC